MATDLSHLPERLGSATELWISPSGAVLAAEVGGFPPSDHAELGLLGSSASDVEVERLEMLETEQECDARADQFGTANAEWHSYERILSSHGRMAKLLLLDLQMQGWVRVSRAYPTSAMRLEGHLERLTALKGDLAVSSPTTLRSVLLVPLNSDEAHARRRQRAAELPLEADGSQPGEPADRRLDAMVALRDDRFGWLTPTGRLITCKLHEHLSRAREESGRKDLFDRLSAAERAVRATSFRAASRHSSIPDRIEARRADTELQTVHSFVVAALYDGGWVRLGAENSLVDL